MRHLGGRMHAGIGAAGGAQPTSSPQNFSIACSIACCTEG